MPHLPSHVPAFSSRKLAEVEVKDLHRVGEWLQLLRRVQLIKMQLSHRWPMAQIFPCQKEPSFRVMLLQCSK